MTGNIASGAETRPAERTPELDARMEGIILDGFGQHRPDLSEAERLARVRTCIDKIWDFVEEVRAGTAG